VEIRSLIVPPPWHGHHITITNTWETSISMRLTGIGASVILVRSSYNSSYILYKFQGKSFRHNEQ
jgi:hypothetical protein